VVVNAHRQPDQGTPLEISSGPHSFDVFFITSQTVSVEGTIHFTMAKLGRPIFDLASSITQTMVDGVVSADF
jgi:hypothetical protein